MSKSVGKSVTRVDAYEKATGRAKYTADLCDQSALVAKILHSTIAHGCVKSIDTAAAEAIPGVVKVLTCFDVPNYPFPTAGHPWSTDPAHQDVADRLLLTLLQRTNISVLFRDVSSVSRKMLTDIRHIVWHCKHVNSISNVKKQRQIFVPHKHCWLQWQASMPYITEQKV